MRTMRRVEQKRSLEVEMPGLVWPAWGWGVNKRHQLSERQGESKVRQERPTSTRDGGAEGTLP